MTHINKTMRRVGVHKIAVPKTPTIGHMIAKKLGPIKPAKKLPKVARPNMPGYFKKGYVF